MADIDDPDEQDGRHRGPRRRRASTSRSSSSTARVVGRGEEGELRVKGPQLCAGYVDTSLDADAFDDDGWFRTGDLGRSTSDGYVVITGRLKDIIIRKGENISAKEVEDLLFTHPKVADVAVIGLPDARRASARVAFVVPADPADAADARGAVRLLHGARG